MIFLGAAALIFVGVLAVVVGSRLSDQALAVLVGAVCGLSMAIPVCLLAVAVVAFRFRDSLGAGRARNVAPSVVVVPPVSQPSWGPGYGYPLQLPGAPDGLFPSAPRRRSFTVVGDGVADDERSR